MSPKDMITEQEVYFDSLMMGEAERREMYEIRRPRHGISSNL